MKNKSQMKEVEGKKKGKEEWEWGKVRKKEKKEKKINSMI
jgi:hypothetical protein